jgi:hypothetical protein
VKFANFLFRSHSHRTVQAEQEQLAMEAVSEREARIQELEHQLRAQTAERRARIQHLEDTVKQLGRKGEAHADLARLSRETGALKLRETALRGELAASRQRCGATPREAVCLPGR